MANDDLAGLDGQGLAAERAKIQDQMQALLTQAGHDPQNVVIQHKISALTARAAHLEDRMKQELNAAGNNLEGPNATL